VLEFVSELFVVFNDSVIIVCVEIVAEIKRIANLTEEQQAELLNNLSEVLEHNIKLLKKSRPKMGEAFSFVFDNVQ
jgi:uncharacterized protein (DUF1778 family)